MDKLIQIYPKIRYNTEIYLAYIERYITGCLFVKKSLCINTFGVLEDFVWTKWCIPSVRCNGSFHENYTQQSQWNSGLSCLFAHQGSCDAFVFFRTIVIIIFIFFWRGFHWWKPRKTGGGWSISPWKKPKQKPVCFLSFGVDALNWQSFTEIGEMACSMTAQCTRGTLLIVNKL